MPGGRRSSQGSIPACAGETSSAMTGMESTGINPRLRGGDAEDQPGQQLAADQSPLARGRLIEIEGTVALSGSIPACAGETTQALAALADGDGSIPACAGETVYTETDEFGSGSIPACAGETPTTRRYSRHSWDQSPRARGDLIQRLGDAGIWDQSPRARGDLIQRLGDAGIWDQSPRARGRHEAVVEVTRVWGSIPACAGETEERVGHDRPARINPRVRGGDWWRGLAGRSWRWINPRVRGGDPRHQTRSPGYLDQSPRARGRQEATCGFTLAVIVLLPKNLCVS